MHTIRKRRRPRIELDRRSIPETRPPKHDQDETAFAAELRRLIHTSNGRPAVHQLAELGPIWEPHLALSAAAEILVHHIQPDLTQPDPTAT